MIANSTAHLYYLTLLWRGGLLFMIPFLIMITIALRNAWKGRQIPMSPEWFFAACAVLMTFTFPSLLWDILIIPSAGALAWFLLGALAPATGHAIQERFPPITHRP